MKDGADSLSVVIATLGGACLRATLEQLNRGTVVPTEILICIPTAEAERVKLLAGTNVKILQTSCRGQVAQRAVGFKAVLGTYVLQMDDDILMETESLGRMKDALANKGRGHAIGPIYQNAADGSCVHRFRSGLRGWLESLYAFLIGGAPWGVKRMGQVSSIGVNYGVDDRRCTTPIFETQWLPGGCVLGFRDDLVSDAFYPFPGKAYCEDIIHSLLRTRRGVRHWVVPSARCSIEVPKNQFPTHAWRGATRAREFYTCLRGGNLWRMRLYGILMRVHWRTLDRSCQRDGK